LGWFVLKYFFGLHIKKLENFQCKIGIGGVTIDPIAPLATRLVSTKQHALLQSSYDAGFFKLKLANFLATGNRWKS